MFRNRRSEELDRKSQRDRDSGGRRPRKNQNGGLINEHQ